MLVTVLHTNVAWAFTPDAHADMTEKVLSGITVDVGGEPRTFKAFSIEWISRSNIAVDAFGPCSGSAALFHPERHFTNEELSASSTRLVQYKRAIIKRLNGRHPDVFGAWGLLGVALHSIQDFYSHSNWVAYQFSLDAFFLGTFEINENLGRSVLPDPPRDDGPGRGDPALNLPACFGDNPDSYSLEGFSSTSLAGLSSGYFVGFGPLSETCAIVPPDPGLLGCGPLPFINKCYHGVYGPFVNDEACPGTNLDRPFSEGGPLEHAEARLLAEIATKDYVEQIIDALRGNNLALRAFLSRSRNRSHGFVIDKSQSMSEELNAIKEQVAALAGQFESQAPDVPQTWILVPFDDPDVGPAFVTGSVASLVGAVDALVASGGAGDCPELAQTALLKAIFAAPDGTKLYLFTDASTKDALPAGPVVNLAQGKSIEITALLTGTCSPVDEALIRVTDETGGQLLVVDPSEIALLFGAIGPQASGDLETIVSAKGTVDGNPRVFEVPVDSTITRLVVSVASAAAGGVSLRRPSGNLVDPSDPGASLAALSSGSVITIDGPEPGIWHVQIAGAGAFSLLAQGISAIDFLRFDLVRPNQDIHGGFFAIPGQPLAGASGLGKATLLGPSTPSTFRLVDTNGQAIQDVLLLQNFPNAERKAFLGAFNLPAVPFRIVAAGIDDAGFPFQRQYPAVYRTQTVGMEVGIPFDDLVPAGQTATFNFILSNLGEAGSFRIDAFAEIGFISAATPPALSLAAGLSQTISVDVIVPANADNLTGFKVIATATKTDDPNVFNSATLDLTVQRDTPPECSSEPPKTVAMWPPNHKFVSVDIAQAAGIVAPGGNPLTITIDSVTQDEPVDAEGNGDGSTAPDAIDDGSGVLLLRSERDGKGNGRVYRVAFTASDQDGSCTGTLFAEVPHDRSGSPVINDGTSFNSILP